MTPRGPARAPRVAGLESAGSPDMGSGPAHFKKRGRLGSVAELASRWGLEARLARAGVWRQALAATLACEVRASRRARTMAGAAYPERRLIVLHAALLEPGRERDRDATFLHECAHMIADLADGRRTGHGAPWRRVMQALGEPPEVRHAIAYLSRQAQASVIWRCRGCGREHPFVRRPRRAVAACHCRRCGPARGRLEERPPAP